jgi:hypothetical protein
MSRLAMGKHFSLFCRNVSDEKIKRIGTLTTAFNFYFEVMVVLLVAHLMLAKACQDGQVLPPPGPCSNWAPVDPSLPFPTPTTLAYPYSSANNGTTRFEKCKQLLRYQNLLLFSDIWGLYYKTFYCRNLRISVKS